MLKSGIYDFVICRGGTDMSFVLGFGRQRPDLKQYRISGLTVFKCAMEDGERTSSSVKRSSLGIPMCTPDKYSRRLKHLSLGMPPCIPFFVNNYQFVPRSTIFLSLHALCAMLGASRSLLF